MNKSDLANKILALEGLSNEDKSSLLELLHEQKKYGLVWEDKPEDVEKRLETELPVLREVTDRAIISDNPDAPNHILIEGDNLEALTALSYTHAGKIDVIYIDPPYNRGENDFKYNDNYIDKDNPFKHSLWLCFMAKRLKIAKKLLKDDGVIIIHIDEHEYNALNLLLETEIFSYENNLGTIVWNKMNPKGDSKGVAAMHEYILVFCRNKNAFLASGHCLNREKPNAKAIIRKANSLFSKLGKRVIPDEIKEAIKPFNYPAAILDDFKVTYDLDLINREFQAWLASSNFGKGEKAYKYISPDGRVFRSVSMAWPNKEQAPADYWIPLIHPTTGDECPLPSKGWRNPPMTMLRLLGEKPAYKVAGLTIKGEVVFSSKKNGSLNIPERIYYLDENMSENVPSIYSDGSSDDTLLSDLRVEFEYPKTVSVAKYLLRNIKYKKSACILDFFAGSGTSLHATMQLNNEDGGKRECIVVTNNENNICEEVTYPRNKRVIRGYTTPKGVDVAGLTDNNLRYYRTELLPQERTNKNMSDLVKASTGLLCIKNDLYTEAPFAGRKLNANYARYFEHGDKRMLVIYNEQAIPFIVNILKEMPSNGKIKVYVFAYGSDPYEADFVDVKDRVTLCALPDAIYNAYKKVLPKRKPKFSVNELVEEIIVEEETEAIADGTLDFNNGYDQEGGEQ